MALWFALEVPRALRRRAEATNQDRGSLFVLRLSWIAAALLGTLAFTRIAAAAYPVGPLVFAIGLLLMWAGIALRWWSFRTLGRYFTFIVMTSRDQPVITRGPYRVIRHPGYAAILLILGGIGLTYGNWLTLAIFVLFPLIGFVNRIRVEEAALSSTLGAAYTSYAARRKRLVPLVW